jgi:hypothetical protein
MSNPTEIHLEFTYTYPDIKAGLRLMNRSLLLSRPLLKWILILSVAVLIFVIFHNPQTAAPSPARSSPSSITFFCINFSPYTLILSIIAGLFIWGKYSHRRNWQKRDKKELNRVTLSPAGLLWETHATRVESKWIQYERFAETPTVFVLFLSDKLGNVLPKRAMTPDQITQTRNLLTSSIGKTQAFEVLPPSPNPPNA